MTVALPPVYVTSTQTDTIHLSADFDHLLSDDPVRTLCGREVGDDWPWGDETLSGVAATCQTCVRVLRG